MKSGELSSYQEEVDRVPFAKSQHGVERLLNWDKLPGQLGNTGRVRLAVRKRHPDFEGGLESNDQDLVRVSQSAET